MTSAYTVNMFIQMLWKG